MRTNKKLICSGHVYTVLSCKSMSDVSVNDSESNTYDIIPTNSIRGDVRLSPAKAGQTFRESGGGSPARAADASVLEVLVRNV